MRSQTPNTKHQTPEKPKAPNSNPWSLPHITEWAGPDAAVCAAEDRLGEVKNMDLETLRKVNGWRDNQKTVQRAIEVRMRKLEKLSGALLKANVADGQFVVVRKKDCAYLAGIGYTPKLAEAVFFRTISNAVASARSVGSRTHRVAQIEGTMLGKTVWG